MTDGLIRLLDHSHIATVVRTVGVDTFMDEVIERLRGAFGDHQPELLETQPRRGFEYRKPGLGLVEWMPAMEVGRRVGVKTVGYHPSNPAERGLASVFANTTLYDTTTGRLTAICDATLLTAVRTGAASAVATDILAIDAPIRLGVIGCGAQSVTQIHALSRVRPIAEVIAFDADPDVAASLSSRLEPVITVPQLTLVDDPADVARAADVLCTVTSADIGAGPVFREAELRDWLHINAVGADFPGKTEIPLSVLHRATVFADYLPQCLLEGEAQQLVADDIEAELPELVANHQRFRALADRLTVFDSTGWAIEDMVAADVAFEYADQLGIGEVFALHDHSVDPFDPYELLRRPADGLGHGERVVR